MYIGFAHNNRRVAPRFRKVGPPLEVYIQRKQKLMEIWVPNQEQQDQRIQDKINALCKKGKESNFSVAVFLSGKEDLQSLTSALLTCNQEKAAARQVEKEGLRQV